MVNFIYNIIKNVASRLFYYIKKFRICFYLLFGLTFTCFTGAVLYQTVADVRDNMTHEPIGKLITVDGKKVHVIETGKQFKGKKPSIVLIAGVGSPCVDWLFVQEELSKHSHVISYDRLGIGWSSNFRTPRTANNIAKELRALLKVLDVRDPTILVGQSMGGAYARAYATIYPKAVKGLVLVEGLNERIYEIRDGMWHSLQNSFTRLVWWNTIFGLKRFYANKEDIFPSPLRTRSKDFQATYKSLVVNNRITTTLFYEAADILKDSGCLKKYNRIKDIPTIMLVSSTPSKGLLPAYYFSQEQRTLFDRDWYVAQREMASYFNAPTFHRVPKSPHKLSIYAHKEVQKAVLTMLKIAGKELKTYPTPVLK